MKKVIVTSLKIILFFIGWALVASVLPLPNSNNQSIWWFWAEITPLLAIVIFTAVFWLVERKTVKLNFSINPAKGFFVGSVAGVLWLTIAVGTMLAIGVMHFESVNPISNLLIWIVAALLNVIMQELLVRGYLYQMIKQKHNNIGATIVTTGLFVAMHGGAFEAGIIPVLNVLSMSLLMTAVLEYTGSIVAPIMMHSIWNIVGAIILGGVSLADDYPHMLNATFSGSMLLSGGACKIEGSIIVLILNILLILYFILQIKKVRRKYEFDKV